MGYNRFSAGSGGYSIKSRIVNVKKSTKFFDSIFNINKKLTLTRTNNNFKELTPSEYYLRIVEPIKYSWVENVYIKDYILSYSFDVSEGIKSKPLFIEDGSLNW